MGKETNIDYNASQAPFMREIARVIVQQNDYTGMGAHGTETHGPHGTHSQISIGVTGRTINLREQK